MADRLGYKPMIIAGLVLRIVGFATLGLVDSVPALLAASAATGLAGALFNPASRAYLAADAGERRVEAFALFNVFYQAGILLGPLVGMVLTGVDFRVTCLVAAGIFALLSIVQIRALPARRGNDAQDTKGTGQWESVLSQWRGIVANRPFLLFSVAMIGFYVMQFQVYLALPLEVRRLGGDGGPPNPRHNRGPASSSATAISLSRCFLQRTIHFTNDFAMQCLDKRNTGAPTSRLR